MESHDQLIEQVESGGWLEWKPAHTIDPVYRRSDITWTHNFILKLCKMLVYVLGSDPGTRESVPEHRTHRPV